MTFTYHVALKIQVKNYKNFVIFFSNWLWTDGHWKIGAHWSFSDRLGNRGLRIDRQWNNSQKEVVQYFAATEGKISPKAVL